MTYLLSSRCLSRLSPRPRRVPRPLPLSLPLPLPLSLPLPLPLSLPLPPLLWPCPSRFVGSGFCFVGLLVGLLVGGAHGWRGLVGWRVEGLDNLDELLFAFVGGAIELVHAAVDFAE